MYYLETLSLTYSCPSEPWNTSFLGLVLVGNMAMLLSTADTVMMVPDLEATPGMAIKESFKPASAGLISTMRIVYAARFCARCCSRDCNCFRGCHDSCGRRGFHEVFNLCSASVIYSPAHTYKHSHSQYQPQIKVWVLDMAYVCKCRGFYSDPYSL